MKPPSPHCSHLTSPSYTNLVFSILLLLGILISYLPQHYRIIARRSSQGISPYFVLLGTTSGTCAFANILVLPTSRADLACCEQITGFQCFSASLGIAQVGVQWSCFSVILLLFLLFFPRATPLMPPKSPSLDNNTPTRSSSTTKTPSYAVAITITAISLLHIFIISLLSLYVLALHPAHAQTYANILGIIATTLASIQYLPQLYTTFMLGSVQSLSIPMMCIQTPGSFVWAASLAKRLGVEGWSAWGVYVVTGTLQGALLVMGICFEVKERRARKMAESDGGARRVRENAVGEETADVETDDEGGHLVEGDGEESASEGEPLLGKRRKR